MQTRKLYIFLLVVALALSACRTPIRKNKNLDCTIPPPVCSPALWDGTPIDTSYDLNERYYYTIKQVEGLNTDKNEYSISNLKNQYFLTKEISNTQKIYNIKKIENDRFEIEDVFLSGENYNIGLLNPDENLSIVSADLESKEDDSYKTGYNDVQLTGIENLIGQSRLYTIIKPFDADSRYLAKINTKIENFENYVWESHPAIDKTNQIIYFASDREGGFGGTDIWYMKINNGQFSNPVNCGPNINTECDELSPFVDEKENKLYFSSAGHKTIGGYDIFESEFYLSGGEPFIKPAKNFGAPVNTEFDEIFPRVLDKRELSFYYSSNQDGEFDIYTLKKVYKKQPDITLDKPEKEEPEIKVKDDLPKVNPKFDLEGEVIDNQSKKPIPDVDVTVRKTNEKEIYKSTKTNERGKYKFELEKGKEYEVKALDDTLFYEAYKVFVDEKDTVKTIKRDLVLDNIKTLRINFKYDKYDDPYKYVLDSLGNQINTTWQESLDNIAQDLKKNIDILEKIIIIGHTDPVGSDYYNKELAQNRAEFVIKQLVERGVPIYLLKAQSKGEKEPLDRIEGESKNQYHKRLRRVTLEKVLSK